MLTRLIEWLFDPPIWFGAFALFILFSVSVTAICWLLITRVFVPVPESVEPPVLETDPYEHTTSPAPVDNKGMELITHSKVAALASRPTPTALVPKNTKRPEPIRRHSDREEIDYRNPDNIDFKIYK